MRRGEKKKERAEKRGGEATLTTRKSPVDPFAFIWSNLTGPNSQLGSAVAKRKLKKHKVTSPFRSFLSSTCFPPPICQRSLVLYLRGNHLHKAFRIALWCESSLSAARHTNFKDAQLFRFCYRVFRKPYFHVLDMCREKPRLAERNSERFL